MSVFSSRLETERKRKHWTKTYTAQRLHLPLTTYANYEYGNREPDINTIKNISDLFSVSTDYLMGKTDSSNEYEETSKPKQIDIDDKDVLFTYKGKPLSDEDRAIIERLMNGKADE